MSKGCLAANDWICGEYLRTRSQELTDATVQHVEITVAAVGIGLLIALPLAFFARRWKLAAPPLLALTTVLYTVPSLAMLAFLVPMLGVSVSVVITALVLYSLTVLLRNILAGLEAVPAEVTEAARGMGYGPLRLLLTVELPLALPALMAGVRMATVSTIAMTTVGGIIDYGGLGNLLFSGLDSVFKAQVLTASVICVVLAIVADVLLLGVQWLLTPWARSRGVRSRGRPGGSTSSGGGSGASATSGAKLAAKASAGEAV